MRILLAAGLLFSAGCVAPGLSRSRSEPAAVDVAARDSKARTRIGVVSRREVELDRLELRLTEGRRCPRRRLPQPEEGIVTASAADRAGCQLYPYRGSLPVYAIRDGSAPVHVLTLHTAVDGTTELPFARADASLRALGAGSLDEYARLEIGAGAWAGTVDLARLRQFLAQWHYRWVRRGRGSPGLYAHRYDGEEAQTARRWAVEDRVQRQRRDRDRVEAGEMSPEAFLEQHAWSPFRDDVAAKSRATTSD